MVSFVRFHRPRKGRAVWGLAAILAVAIHIPLRADQYHGINAGAPVWGGVIQFTQAKAAAIAATGCRAVRMNFRLDGHASWDASLLAQYDTIIQTARNNNLIVLGLFSSECMPVGQAAFNDDPDGDGMNQYVLDYKATVLLLVDRYKTQIKRWEIWNEPNAWTNSNYQNDPKNAGGTYILPRVYANLLAESYKKCEIDQGRALLASYNIDFVSGGLFAHDIGGSFSHAMDYMQQVYDRTPVWNAFQPLAGRRYPWRIFGYHFYLGYGGSAFTTTQLGQFLNQVRSVQSANSDPSPIFITEFGWNTAAFSEAVSSTNMHNADDFMETKAYLLGTFWYQWVDDSGTELWGITRTNGTQKPSYNEFLLQNANNLPPPEPQVVAAGNPLTVNAGQSIHLSATISFFTGASAASWRWVIGTQTQTGSGSPPSLDTVMNQAGDIAIHLEVTDSNGLRGFSNTLTVHVTEIPHSPADFDRDGDVDMKDFAHLQLCFTGPAINVTDPNCQNCQLDGDTHVDSVDLNIFVGCMKGADVVVDPTCGVQ